MLILIRADQLPAVASRRGGIAAAFLSYPKILLAIGPASAQGLTPDQRNDVVAIIRNALKTDSSILGDAVERLQERSAQRQKAAAKQALAARHDVLFANDDPAAGASDPSVTLVEFFDTNCPYCRQVDPMLKEWLENGPKLRIIYKDMPVLGPSSVLGSEALLAARRQDGYLKLRDTIMQAPPDLTETSLQTLAREAGLDWARLRTDMDDPAIQQRLDANVGLAREFGVEGTPAFVVGDRLVVGSDMAELQSAITAARRR